MLAIFVVLQVIAFCLIYLFVPETARCKPSERDTLNHMSLEELNAVFNEKSLHHTNWRIREATPARLKWGVWRLTPNRDPQKEPPMAMQVHRWTGGRDNGEQTIQPANQGANTSQPLFDQTGVTSARSEEARVNTTQLSYGSGYAISASTTQPNPIQSAAQSRIQTDNNDRPMTLHLNDGTTMPDGQGPRTRTRRFY